MSFHVMIFRFDPFPRFNEYRVKINLNLMKLPKLDMYVYSATHFKRAHRDFYGTNDKISCIKISSLT